MVVNQSQALEHLNSGGILIYPTDTVYGIGCLAQYASQLKEIKPRESGFIVIVDNFQRYLDWFDEPFTPPPSDRPTTWVVKASKKVPKILQNQGNIAIREVSSQPIGTILEKLNEPLVSTSANYPKKPTPTSIKELEKIFDYPILEGKNGNGKPSTIIHYQSKRIIRP